MRNSVTANGQYLFPDFRKLYNEELHDAYCLFGSSHHGECNGKGMWYTWVEEKNTEGFGRET